MQQHMSWNMVHAHVAEEAARPCWHAVSAPSTHGGSGAQGNDQTVRQQAACEQRGADKSRPAHP